MTVDFIKIQDGQEVEIKRLTRMVSDWTYHFVQCIVQNHHDTEEVVQDVLLKVLDEIVDESATLPNEDKWFKAWVYKIALNKARDKVRFYQQKKRKGMVESLPDTEDYILNPNAHLQHPDLILESKEKVDFLWQCIYVLPEKQKEALLLIKIEHYSVNEAAEIMNISYKAAESLLARAKTNLKLLITNNKNFDNE